jgi:hypothetical protein
LKVLIGGFYFCPTDEGLSAGTAEREKPLGILVSVESRIENAAVRQQRTLARIKVDKKWIELLNIGFPRFGVPDGRYCPVGARR